ncbi:MAG: hypothetical protein IJK52_01890 [Oscillospiraceae bacterium]|nr:hypothetical protein [Oscillospiraceae bacterium]
MNFTVLAVAAGTAAVFAELAYVFRIRPVLDDLEIEREIKRGKTVQNDE